MTVLRDAEPRDLPAVRRLVGQLGYAPDEARVPATLRPRVLATAGPRIVVAVQDGAIAGVIHVFERPARIGYRLKAMSPLLGRP